MELQALGIVTLLLGAISLFLRPFRACLVLALLTMLGAAAAFTLPALGGASILVPHLFLVFFVARIFMAYGEGPILDAFMPPRPGFWFFLLMFLAVGSAYFGPRLFAGSIDTMSVIRLKSGASLISLNPLYPSSTNITQGFYAIGNLLCFGCAYAYGKRISSESRIVKIFLIVAAAHLAFGLVDIVTYQFGMSYLLDIFRTANYSYLTEVELSGLKRITGAFAEASSYAGYTLGLFGFAFSLWLDRYRSGYVGIVAALLFVAIMISTSTTGIVGVIAVGLLLLLRSLWGMIMRPGAGRPVVPLTIAFVGMGLMATVPLLMPGFWDDVVNYANEVVFTKLESDSARERFAWNSSAWNVFLDTNGLGAGLGSARASSYLFILASNVGVAGLLLMGLFVATLLFAPTGISSRSSGPRELQIAQLKRALDAGVISILVSAFMSATTFDLGIMFYLYCGLSASLLWKHQFAVKQNRRKLLQYTNFPAVSGLRKSD